MRFGLQRNLLNQMSRSKMSTHQERYAMSRCKMGYICNSYTMAARNIADIYTQSPRTMGVYSLQLRYCIIDINHALTLG